MQTLTCIEQDDFKMLVIGKVYHVEKVVNYQGEIYVAVVGISGYLYPQRRFKETFEDFK